MKITVDGSPLPPSQPAVRHGQEWLLPLRAISRALSAEVVDVGDQDTIRVRADGAEYTVDLQTGQVRNGYALAGRIPAGPARLIRLNDELMIPVSGIVALFAVSVEENAERNTLVIESNRGSSSNGFMDANRGQPALHVLGLNYAYGFTTNGSQFGQIAHLEGQGLLRGIKIRGTMDASQVPGRPLPGDAHASLRAELNPESAVLLGDQSTHSGMDAMSLSMRGVGYETRIRGFSSYYYVGRGRGSTSAALGTNGVGKYDTTFGGFSLRYRNTEREVIFAGNSFHGAARKGTTLGAAFGNSRKRNYFKVQTLIGRFSGVSANTQTDGFGYGVVATDTFTPAPMLSATAQTEHYGRNFLTARDDTRFSGQTNSALGLVLRPASSMSISGGVVDRVTAGVDGRSAGFNYGVQYALRTTSSLLFGYFRNVVQDAASSAGRFDMTRYSLNVPDMHRYSFTVQYSDIRNGSSVVQDLMLLGARRTPWGHFSLENQIQFGQTHRYGFDWLVNLGPRDAHLQFGADYRTSISGSRTTSPRVSLRLPFLGGHSLQLKYNREPGNHLLQIGVAGPVIRQRDLERSKGGESLVVRPSNLKGRVYFDTNNDGRFDESTDRPVAGLTLWLDGAIRALTDALGAFRFSQIEPGAHRLKADLAGVPADLVLAENAERTVAVIPYRENVQDFRVIRTGRIVGKVTTIDYDEGTDSPVERPLPDVRIIVGPNLDTYTETDGLFIAGDLMPGEYSLRIDPATIPEGYVSRPESISISMNPGRSDESARFHVSRAPRSIVERELPPQDIIPIN